MKELDELARKAKEAKLTLYDAARKAYPVGTKIRFRKGRGEVVAVVKMQNEYHGTRFFVENLTTGKEYWQEFYEGHWPLKVGVL